MAMLNFYDASTRSTFKTDKYTVEKDKRGRDRAVAIGPNGNKLYQYIKMK